MHASMANLQLQFRNPTQEYPIPTPDEFSAFCAWPEGRRPFYSGGQERVVMLVMLVMPVLMSVQMLMLEEMPWRASVVVVFFCG